MSTPEAKVESQSSLDAFNLNEFVCDKGPLRMVIQAELRPVADIDRFQPAGFPEIGHVIYPAPRQDGTIEHVCIVDSAASMANHLEAVCRAAPHDPDAIADLAGMPYLRCVTDAGWPEHGSEKNKAKPKQVVVTSLTEGHRIASTYFLGGKKFDADGNTSETEFSQEFASECGILNLDKNAYAPPEAWWTVFSTIFKYDPNALVHGVLFLKWNIKISRVLTAHLEAFGAARVDRSGVKFDRLGKTTSGQPIFTVDDATAHKIRATFILDLALLRSFGRGEKGLNTKQKEFLLALSLWKIGRLVGGPFRYRSGCDLECMKALWGEGDVINALGKIDINSAILNAGFELSQTDIYWPANGLYRQGDSDTGTTSNNSGPDADTDSQEDGGEDHDDNESNSED